MKNVIDKKLCTGCTACYAACPNGGIKMIADKEGLLYPAITDTCISCDKCLKVCPRINKKASASNFNKRAYAATSKNSKIWRRSSSGGAFSEICKAFGDENTIVCGAAWDGLKVHHICVEGVENIMPLCKSKYVASSLENVFIEIKNHLGNDRKVIFCGTPCQVAGLKGFLNQNQIGRASCRVRV